MGSVRTSPKIEIKAMRLARLTVLELMIVVLALGLLCSVPFQCRRVMEAGDCRVAAGMHAESAEELAVMADHPAEWMDEFRAELRRRALWEDRQSQRLAQSTVYDNDQEHRIAEADMSDGDQQQFWAHFNAIAAQRGYQRPQIRHRSTGPSTMRECIAGCWPTLFLIVLLLFCFRRQRRRHRERIEGRGKKSGTKSARSPPGG